MILKKIIVTEDKIKRYLLGGMDEDAAARFEEECSLDEKLHEQFCAVESELIDEYLTYSLSADERKSFEEKYLINDARRAKVASARVFLARIKDFDSAENAPQANGFGGFLGNRLFWRFAFLGLLLVFFVGILIYFVTHREPRAELAQSEIPAEMPVIKPRDGGENQFANSKNQTSPAPETHQNQNAPTPEAKHLATNKTTSAKSEKTARFVLQAGTLRSTEGEQFIKFPAQTAKVNLRLELPPEARKYETYQITLKDAEGETISQQTDLKDPNITLPANQLRKQTYVIFLEGKKEADAPESIAEFTFRVRR